MADPIRYTHNLTGRRRLIKTHLPLPFLPPGILTTCKVLLSHSHSSDWDAQRWSWWPGTWRTAQCPTSTTTSTSPPMTLSATSTPLPRCSSWASSTTAHIGGTWEALRGPKEFWDSGVHPWCNAKVLSTFLVDWRRMKNSFINTFVEKWRSKGRFYYHLKSNFQIWGNDTWPKIRNTSSLWLPGGQTDRQKGVKHWGFYLNQFNVFQKVDGLLKHLAFDNMKKNPAVNPFASDIKPTGMRGHFVREGKVTHTQPYLITRCVQI